MIWHKKIKLLLMALLLGFSAVSVSSVLTSCGGETKKVDYAGETRILSEGWETSNFIQTGVGIVDLYKSVDGDTAHFTLGDHLIQGRFNGIDTPESTGILEKWGLQASNFTKEKLTSAKTIVLETEPNNEASGPEQDGNGRYLVWVWYSERTPEEEDGSELYLLNLQLVQEGFSSTKGVSGSAYSEVIYAADAQAQKLKIHLYSDDDDPLYYEGDAIVNELDVYQHPDKYVGSKVYLTGTVTRTLGTNAYIQKTLYDEEGQEIGTYGMYIFTQYKQYDILAKGNEIAATGTIAERYGAYQLINVSYSNVDVLKGEDDMLLLSRNNQVDPLLITAAEANTNAYMNVLVTIENLTITGGYGGYENNYADCMESPDASQDYCMSNSNNSMTLYASQTDPDSQSSVDFCIRIDSSTFIKNKNGATIRNYNYFVGQTLTLTGVMSMYESEKTGNNTVQLMLLATSDITYIGE